MMLSELATQTGLPSRYLRVLIKKMGGRVAKDGRIMLEDAYVVSIVKRYPKKTTAAMVRTHRLLHLKSVDNSLLRDELRTLRRLNLIFGDCVNEESSSGCARRGPMYEISPRGANGVIRAGHPGLGKKS